MDITREEDREHLYHLAKDLFREISQKYKEHNIQEKPFIFLKSDTGTYGMGVMPIEDPQEIIDLNRKGRNKLLKGKGAKVIQHFILQEGVSTTSSIDQKPSEVCLYQLSNHYIGSFMRFNTQKSSRENLNSQGMLFKKSDEDIPHSSLEIYCILARIAALAAAHE